MHSLRPGVGCGARWAHCTRPDGPCQVPRSSDLRFRLLTGISQCLCPFWGTCPNWGIADRSSVLNTCVCHDAAYDPERCRSSQNVRARGSAERPEARRPPPPVARRRGPDADRPRRRSLLQGVHLPDRARQDPPDERDGRLARDAPGGRRRLPRERDLRRRACEGRGDPRPRRHAARRARVRGGDRRVHEVAPRRPRHGRAGVARAGAERRGDGARTERRRQDGADDARRVPRARRRRKLLRHRPRRRALPARRLPLHALEHRDGGQPLQRGARPLRALGPSLGRASAQRLRLALTVLPAAARLRGSAGGRRACARARRGDARRTGPRPGLLPGLDAGRARRVTGSSPAPMPRRRRCSTRSSPTAPISAGF